ncbi:hypothetical protein NSP_12980 [Nodularia spumigena CCY9414]|nr:hypothetical protein NSP_12980 [Nodularia spumigena CCY9414]
MDEFCRYFRHVASIPNLTLSCYRSRVLSISILLRAGEEKAMKYEL